jgi:exportin-5
VWLQHARGLEAFAKFLPSAPELLVPLITTSFEAMGVVPIEANGQLPPPAKVTPQWKDDAVARMSLAKVGVGLGCR